MPFVVSPYIIAYNAQSDPLVVGSSIKLLGWKSFATVRQLTPCKPSREDENFPQLGKYERSSSEIFWAERVSGEHGEKEEERGGCNGNERKMKMNMRERSEM